MNERIQELADEARIKFSSHWAHEGVDTAVITRRDLKDFAQLIVQECAEIALLDGQTTGNFEVFNKFQKHFGVEE